MYQKARAVASGFNSIASAPLACSFAFDDKDILNRERFLQTGP